MYGILTSTSGALSQHLGEAVVSLHVGGQVQQQAAEPGAGQLHAVPGVVPCQGCQGCTAGPALARAQIRVHHVQQLQTTSSSTS